jgi:hypothetical protein
MPKVPQHICKSLPEYCAFFPSPFQENEHELPVTQLACARSKNNARLVDVASMVVRSGRFAPYEEKTNAVTREGSLV